jgi:prophage regulatory protein
MYLIGITLIQQVISQMRDQILRPAQTAVKIGVSGSTLVRLAKTPDFPPRVQLGARSIGYSEAALDAWLESRQQKTNAQ